MKRKVLHILIILVLALGLCLVTAAPASAAIITVDDDISADYTTIQEAIDAASPGDTIIVGPGEYAGAIVDKSVTVSGTPGGVSVITTGVPYKPGNDYLQSAFRPEADGAEIRNFTINCDGDPDLGVYAKGINNITVDSLYINTDGTVQGITNWGGTGWVITNNIITNTVAAGGGGIGIFLGAQPPSIYDSSPYNRVCAGNLVQGNTIASTATADTYSCPGIALCLDLRYEGYDNRDFTEDVSGNQIIGNTITSTGVNNAVGIEVGTILGDSGEDPLRNDPVAIADLMAIGALHDNLVQGNLVDGAETGIYFYNVTGLTVTQNEIINSVEDGIYAEHGHEGVNINYNNIYGNTYGFEHEDIPGVDNGPINAEFNWWGNTSGPLDTVGTIEVPSATFVTVTDMLNADGSGDEVSELVDYYPWLVFPAGPSSGGVGMSIMVPEIVAISVEPSGLDFGVLMPGDLAPEPPFELTVTNIGTVTVDVDAYLEPDGTVFDNLFIGPPDMGLVYLWPGYANLTVGGGPPYPGSFFDVFVQLDVPGDYEARGPENAVLVFEAIPPE